jgi:hypothetical protein
MVMASGLQLNLNRVIGRTGNDPFLDAQRAANVWASTNLDLLGALNAKAGTNGLGLNKVCQTLATTAGKNLDADGASEYFTA